MSVSNSRPFCANLIIEVSRVTCDHSCEYLSESIKHLAQPVIGERERKLFGVSIILALILLTGVKVLLR